MNDENIVTITWVNERTGELREMDVAAEDAESLGRGKAIGGYNLPQRRFSATEGIARLQARVDQIEARRDELVDEYPELKSHGRRFTGDDA